MTLLALAVCAAYGLVALLALVQPGPRPALSRGIAMPALAAGVWMAAQAAWYQGWLPERWDGFNARLPIFSLLVLAILFSAWVYAYLDIKVNFWQPAGLLLVAGLLWLDANPARLPDVLWSNTRWQLQRIDFILAALTCIWAFMLGQAALAALRLYRRTTQPFARNRVKYLAPVMGLVVLGQVFFLARYWALGSLIHLAGFLLAAYAVLNKRLPSLRRVFIRGVSALLTGGIAVTVFAGVFWLAQLVFRSASGLPDWFISSAVGSPCGFASIAGIEPPDANCSSAS